MGRRRICGLIGHDFDPEADACGVAQCLRCGASSYWGDEAGLRQPWHIALIERLRWRWFHGRGRRARRLAQWLKCPDCGGRFGRHDFDRCIAF